jgi:minor histocompatibility antigen H13
MPRPVVLCSLLGIVVLELACLYSVPVPCSLQMFLLTQFVLVVGCELGAGLSVGDREPAMTAGDSAGMPFVAGTMLVGLYLAFKYLDTAMINLVLRAYFTVFGAGAAAAAALPLCTRLLDGSAALFELPLHWVQLAKKGLPVTQAHLLAGLAGAAAAGWWCATSHWLGNNLLGVAFCVLGLSSMNVGSIKNSTLVLVGLFFYDIFMVFGTGYLLGSNKVSIMEEVATKVEGPIKLLFPLPPLEARGRASPYSMLGLGDIIVPGIHLALLQRFDAALSAAAAAAAGGGAPAPTSEAPTPYFNAGCFAYALGIIATNVSMHYMNTAQPALLFLVPLVLAVPALLALASGHASQLWEFKEEEPEGQPGGEGQGEAQESTLDKLLVGALGRPACEMLGLVGKQKAK